MNNTIGMNMVPCGCRPDQGSGIWSLDSNGNLAWEGSDVNLSWGLPRDKPRWGNGNLFWVTMFPSFSIFMAGWHIG